jgi:hypothetical protein
VARAVSDDPNPLFALDLWQPASTLWRAYFPERRERLQSAEVALTSAFRGRADRRRRGYSELSQPHAPEAWAVRRLLSLSPVLFL